MSHVGPGWSPTWRTHSCVPCRHLLFDTVCESCARTGRREESSLSLTVPSLNLVLRSELASVWLNGARRQYLFRVECAFGRVFVFEEQEDVFPAG